MIHTHAFVIPKKDMMKLMLYQTFKTYKWLFLFLILAGIYAANDFSNPVSRFMVFFCLLYPLIILGSAYLTLTSKWNKVFFKPRTYTFEEQKFNCLVGDQTIVAAQIKNEYTYDAIIKKGQFSGYWLLYIAKARAMAIPVSAFQNETDLNSFVELINRKVK